MALQNKKIKELYLYYLQYGFDHTIEEIADALGIVPKTFFNRYGNKEQSILLARAHWHQIITERYKHQLIQCNHTVEELLIFVSEMLRIQIQEQSYYLYEQAHGLFTDAGTPYIEMLTCVIRKGIRHFHFHEKIDIPVFAALFIHNLCYYLPLSADKEKTLQLLLEPLLTERGKELLEEIDISAFLCF